MPLQNPTENEVTQEEEPSILPAPKRRKVIKFRKCKKELHSDMMSCENPNCNIWVCNNTCWPKIFVIGSAFFCCKSYYMYFILIGFNRNSVKSDLFFFWFSCFQIQFTFLLFYFFISNICFCIFYQM